MVDDLPKRDLQKLLEIISKVVKCSSVPEFEDALQNLCSLLPYDKVLCVSGNAHTCTTDIMVSHNFPGHYLQLYAVQNIHKEDPCIERSLLLGEPHFYNIHDDKEYDQTIADSSNQRYKSLSQDFNLVKNLSSVLTDASGKATYLCLASPTEKPHPRSLRIVNILMPHIHHTIIRIYKTDKANGLPALSNREYEILKWVMEGKTNWAISQILTISEGTVKFHLANTYRKLEVVSRGHAIAKMLQLGIQTV